MQLSERLQTIASLVSKGGRLVDVGCDHGYLPIELIQRGIISSAVAMDINQGPLQRAEEHIREYGLENRIETRLSDGLMNAEPNIGETLVIAGMGGALMERILSAKPDVRDSFQELILQPQSEIPHMRLYLHENGYRILDEKAVLEDGKFYFMMKAVKGEETTGYGELEYRFGRILLKQKDEVLRKFLERELNIRNTILNSLQNSSNAATDERKITVKEDMQYIRTALDTYEYSRCHNMVE